MDWGGSLAVGLAMGASIALPPWPLSPDGEVIAVRGADALRAEGAAVERIDAGLWRVLPTTGVKEVRLTAGDASVEAAVEPPPGRIALEAKPGSPVKGRDAEVDLEVTVHQAGGGIDGDAALPVLASSVGTIRELRRTGPGKFSARYTLPKARYPELAVLTAVAPRCPLCATPRAIGTAVVPLVAAIDLPGKTEPGVNILVQLGGKEFGPVPADAQGRFSIPIVVAPGQRYATGVALDRAGNRKLFRIDLRLPPIDRLSCAAWPPALPADGRAQSQIWCVATDDTGRRAPNARLDLRASRGTLLPLERMGEGVFRARYQTPQGGGGRGDLITASYPDGGATSRQEVTIALTTGAPVDMGYELEREPVPVGATVPYRAWARDAQGDPLGAPEGVAGAALGFVGPNRFVARPELGDWVQSSSLRLVLPPREAAKGATVTSLALWRAGNEWVALALGADAHPVSGAPLRFGAGATASTDAHGVARTPARGETEWVRSESGARAAGWSDRGPPARSDGMEKSFPVPLRPRSAVDVRVRRDGGVIRFWVEDPEGKLLSDRQVALAASGLRLGEVARSKGMGSCPIQGSGTVTVTDVATGVAAVLEVR
jgi:hypothetical protein